MWAPSVTTHIIEGCLTTSVEVGCEHFRPVWTRLRKHTGRTGEHSINRSMRTEKTLTNSDRRGREHSQRPWIEDDQDHNG